MKRNIQKLKVDLSQIPCPFNLREHAERVETGPVQFNDDWPGVFIRGDNAAYLAICLDSALRELSSQDTSFESAFHLNALQHLLELLKGSNISNITDNDNDIGC